MEAEINDVLRQASMAAGIFEDEPADSSNSQDDHQDESMVTHSDKPANYSATEQDEDELPPVKEENIKEESLADIKAEVDSSQPTGNGGHEHPGNGDGHEVDELNTSSDDNQADTSTEDIAHNQTDGHVDSRRSRYLKALKQESENAGAATTTAEVTDAAPVPVVSSVLTAPVPESTVPSLSVAEADSTDQDEGIPKVESTSDSVLPGPDEPMDSAVSDDVDPIDTQPVETSNQGEQEQVQSDPKPLVDQNGSDTQDTQDSPASSQATIFDSAANQKTDEVSSEATELPSTAESSETEAPAFAEVGKKDLLVKIDKLPVAPQAPVKGGSEEDSIKPAESGSKSPGQGERWSLRTRKRKESTAEESRGKRTRQVDDKEDEEEGRKTRGGRRKSTDSNVSSGASEHSSVSRNSGPSTPRGGGSPRLRRASEDNARGGVSRRVLRNTVKTVPEEVSPAPKTVGRRASKNK